MMELYYPDLVFGHNHTVVRAIMQLKGLRLGPGDRDGMVKMVFIQQCHQNRFIKSNANKIKFTTVDVKIYYNILQYFGSVSQGCFQM